MSEPSQTHSSLCLAGEDDPDCPCIEIDRRTRIAYLEAALTPGSEINRNTTFYEGKGEAMRAELAELQARAQARAASSD